MKSNCILLVPFHNFFNPDVVPLFEEMDKKHSAFLYTTLYLNNMEILNNYRNKYDIILCITKEDEQNIPQEIRTGEWNTIIIEPSNPIDLGKHLNNKYFSKYNNNLIINPLSIGFNSSDINKIIELLSIEDDSLVIGRSKNNRVPFLGFNKFGTDLIYNFDKSDFDFEKYISLVFKNNYFISVLDNGMYISDLNDFKILYKELSKKESLGYCSQKMHELFTHLFIEYKELLK